MNQSYFLYRNNIRVLLLAWALSRSFRNSSNAPQQGDRMLGRVCVFHTRKSQRIYTIVFFVVFRNSRDLANPPRSMSPHPSHAVPPRHIFLLVSPRGFFPQNSSCDFLIDTIKIWFNPSKPEISKLPCQSFYIQLLHCTCELSSPKNNGLDKAWVYVKNAFLIS